MLLIFSPKKDNENYKICKICLKVEIYEDKDNARKDEIAALGGQTLSGGTNVFSAFYDRLKEVLLSSGSYKF